MTRAAPAVCFRASGNASVVPAPAAYPKEKLPTAATISNIRLPSGRESTESARSLKTATDSAMLTRPIVSPYGNKESWRLNKKPAHEQPEIPRNEALCR